MKDEMKTTILVRLFDQAGNKYDHYSGELVGCPPIPRIGEHITNAHLGNGKVTKIEHETQEGKNFTAYTVLVHFRAKDTKNDPTAKPD
jgi:hypothetical protein